MAIFNLTYDSTKEAYVANLSNYYVVVDFNATSWGTELDKVRLYQSPMQYVHHSNNMTTSRSKLTEDGLNAWTGSLTGPFPDINFKIVNDNGSYSFDENYIPTPQPTPSSDVDTSMGANYYEEDLTTNVKKYFAESFKFDGSQFEMDGDRIVGLKQSFIDTLATDLTNIVNTSISTATLTADTATINQTLTALGINTDLLKTKDLRLVDPQGHEHKLHLGN